MHMFINFIPKCHSLAYYAQEYGFCLADKLNFTKKNSDAKQSAGSHIQSCWLIWH